MLLKLRLHESEAGREDGEDDEDDHKEENEAGTFEEGINFSCVSIFTHSRIPFRSDNLIFAYLRLLGPDYSENN